MINNQNLSTKCQACFKLDRGNIVNNCQLCRDLSLHESVLCDLNRDTQSSGTDFVCNAYQPPLRLVSSEKMQGPNLADNNHKQNELLLSDKTKYNIALNLQKLGRDPNHIYAVLKYHVVWNVYQREKSFPESQNLMESILPIFMNPFKQADTIVLPLWIAPDHVHVYIETNMRVSIDKIIQKIKKATEHKLLRRLKDIAGSDSKSPLWDDAYFVRTIG